MLLYVTGSYPENQEGIASGAKVLLNEMINEKSAEDFLLLTTDTQIITRNIEKNANCRYELMPNWKLSLANRRRFESILDKYDIEAIHMEYPGDLYGKTFLASFLPYILKKYNKKHGTKITYNVRLHEFSRARLLRRIAIIPILKYSDRVYVPAQKDREIVSKYANAEVKQAIIGTNISVVSNEIIEDEKVTIAYFGSVYPGKGIEKMLSIWKQIREDDIEDKFRYKIIGEIDTDDNNHFQEYHKRVWKWIEEYGLKDVITVTGYVTDEQVSYEIQHSQIATLFYEDGLTLRRGSFLAFLAHGTPIVTSLGDEESNQLFNGHKGVSMCLNENAMIEAIKKYSELSIKEKEEIRKDAIELSRNFEWKNIAKGFLRDYGVAE